MTNLPAPRTVAQLPDGTWTYADQTPAVPAPQAQPQVVHVHQAPPDRTLQRVALGSGIGAGATVAGVYCGPLLVGVLTAIAANLALCVLLLAVTAWGVVEVVRSVGGKKGAAAVANVTAARRGLRRRKG